MAGDWIKMRGNLWDDPRVARICDLTGSTEGPVIGALYWLWATADQHSEDGAMPGLTLRQIDRKTNLQGFGAALIDVGWLADAPSGVVIQKFEEHNGASAKKRCQTAKRVANHRALDDAVTHQALPSRDDGVIGALAREEKRREENKELPEQPAQSSQPVSCAAEICRALRVAGVTAVQSQHPMLLALVDAGATLTEFVDAVPSAAGKRDAFAYLLSVVKGRRDDAARDAQALARGNFAAQGPPRQADRKHRQLATAAVLTGQTPTPNQPIRTLHPEAIDVESRILAP